MSNIKVVVDEVKAVDSFKVRQEYINKHFKAVEEHFAYLKSLSSNSREVA